MKVTQYVGSRGPCAQPCRALPSACAFVEGSHVANSLFHMPMVRDKLVFEYENIPDMVTLRRKNLKDNR